MLRNKHTLSQTAASSSPSAGPQHAGVPEVEVVSEDGSPHGPKTFVLWNPPLLQPGRRGSGKASNPLEGLHSMSRTEARVRMRNGVNKCAFSACCECYPMGDPRGPCSD